MQFLKPLVLSLLFVGLSSVGFGASSNSVLTAKIDGHIGPATVFYLKHVFKLSEADNIKAVLLKINTPGGLLVSTREIVGLVNQSSKPVITFVTPSAARAGSAGAFILLAGHLAIMREGTNVGAASPIQSDGNDIGATLKEKVFNDTKAFMRAIAESRNRDSKVAEKFVTEALSLTAKEAVKKGVINLKVAPNSSIQDILKGQTIDYGDQPLVFEDSDIELLAVKPRVIDQFLAFISVPNIAYLLTSVGTLAIYIEVFSGFSMVFLGLGGLISFVLGMIALSTLPIHAGFLSLLLLGCVLIAIELYVAGFGVFGIAGFVSFLFGSLYLFNEPLISRDYTIVVYWVSGALAVILLSLLYIVTRKPTSSRSYIGEKGECATDFINGAGFVTLGNKTYKATSESHLNLKQGEAVKVVDVRRNIITVTRSHGAFGAR